MATVQSKNTAYVMHAIGDEETGLEVAAGGTLEGGPIDISRLDLSQSTIVLTRTGGTGTLKVTGEISFNGIDDKVSLGDLITAVTSASKAYKLSDSGFTYGHYLILTAEETASAATADARVTIMGVGA